MPTYFVSYPGDLTSEDRAALERPGFKLYENGTEVSYGAFDGDTSEPLIPYQWVRLDADSTEAAVHTVIDALGHAPDGVRAIEGKPQ